MNGFVRKYWKTVLFFALAGLIGGFFTGLYLLDSYPEEIRAQLAAQGINDFLLGVITAVQSAGYGLVLGTAGILLGKMTGMWKDERKLEKKPLLWTGIVAVLGGMFISPPGAITRRYSSGSVNAKRLVTTPAAPSGTGIWAAVAQSH